MRQLRAVSILQYNISFTIHVIFTYLFLKDSDLLDMYINGIKMVHALMIFNMHTFSSNINSNMTPSRRYSHIYSNAFYYKAIW